jgi:hypothetical protein
MVRDGGDLIILDEPGHDPGAVPRQVEILSAWFHEWEQRGRGWGLHPYPVDLEPPFIPFQRHSIPPLLPGFDDGRRPTVLSRLTEGVQRLVTGRPRSPTVLDLEALFPEEPLPEPFEDDEQIVELRLSVPPPMKVNREAVEQSLLGLPVATGPLAFEVVAVEEEIRIQLAARERDADAILERLRGYFPQVVLTRDRDHVESRWRSLARAPSLFVDFGLSREFMLPLRTFRGFEVDPLIGITAALSNLAPGEIAVLQVLFQPVANPWAESILRSVHDDEGGPFFLDAPEFTSAAKTKAAHPLFAAVLRIGVRSSDPGRVWEIGRGLGGTLQTFGQAGGNSLIPLTNEEYDEADHEEDFLRRRSRRSGMILNAEELVSLVHPPSSSVRAEKLKREDRKTRAAPATVAGSGLLLGTNTHAGKTVQVALNPEQRSRHMYVIGASGTGKSTLLLNLILQDLQSGQGIGVLDPHGDLIDQVLQRLPEHRLDDVVLVDPADADWPVGFNILSARSELERTLLSSDLVAVFRRLSTSWGDQMTSVLGNAISAFLESDRGGTLVDLKRFLVERAFREEILATVRDPQVVYYWQKEFPLLKGNPQASILTRLDTFLRPKLIRYMVAQKDDRLDFRRIMDEGKILLARLSQGAIGEENANLLGSLLVSKLQQTAISRQDVAEKERRPFYLYIDEFQNFVTPTMEQILSGARKFHLGLILAHQDLRQIASRSPDVLSSVLTNPHTRVAFRVGDQDARALAEAFASFEAKDLQSLGIGQAIARVQQADFDFNLDTLPLEGIEDEAGQARRDAAVTRSRVKYARSREEVEAVLREMIQVRETPTVAARTEVARPEPEIRKPRERIVPAVTVQPVALQALPEGIPSAGRGGEQHRYVQELLRRWAEAHGWRAVVEESILDGMGRVDLALRKGDHALACEIAISSPPENELANIQKCLTAGFERVVSVSPDKKILARIRELAERALQETNLSRVRFCSPEEAFGALEEYEAETTGETKTVRGYKVKVQYQAAAKGPRPSRREAVSKVIASALRRVKGRS